VRSDFPARCRHALAVTLLLLAVAAFGPPCFGPSVRVAAAGVQEGAERGESTVDAAEAEGGWSSTIAKAANFAALAGLLTYFLKAPVAAYLRTRSETIRRDLTDAADLRAAAEQQLADVRARLAALPAELERLRRRGQEELVDERSRLAEATAREKQHVIDRTRREIDLQFRVARRHLLEHAAELSISLARTRIERDITPDDQARLIDRYAAEVRL
jgi:F-type H+-transporting ATPase subunit b